MEKFAVYKIFDFKLELCGLFDSMKEATDYLTDVKKEVMYNFATEYKGDYIISPAIYYKIDNEQKV